MSTTEQDQLIKDLADLYEEYRAARSEGFPVEKPVDIKFEDFMLWLRMRASAQRTKLTEVEKG